MKRTNGDAVRHVDGDLRRFGQLLADFGRQAGADLHLVALAVGQAFDAELLAFLHEVLRVLAVDRDELRDIRLRAAQVFGELEAQARRRRLGVGLVVGHAEAVLGAQLVVGFARRLIVGEIEAEFQRVDRRAPVGAALRAFARARTVRAPCRLGAVAR